MARQRQRNSGGGGGGGGLLSKVWGLMTSPTGKAICGWLLSMIAGASTVAYTTSAMIESKIRDIGSPRIPRLKPPHFKPGDAIGQTRFGNAGCSATIIGPVGDDDHFIDVLTAAHCQEKGARGTMKIKDGRAFEVECIAIDHKADVAWLRAERPAGPVPFLLMADESPVPGAKVWHMGYGIDKPANKEEGHFVGETPDAQKFQYRLSVSPGDSGGGILLTSNSRVLSPVCCTTRLGGTGDVWGGTPARALAIRPHKATRDEPDEATHPRLELADDCDEECDFLWLLPPPAKKLPRGPAVPLPPK